MLEILILLSSAFLGTVIGMIAGFASSTTMLLIILLFFPIHTTLIFVGIAHLFAEIGKISLSYKHMKIKHFIGFALPAMITTYLGAKTVFEYDPLTLQRGLGVFFIAYVIFLLYHPSFELKPNNKTAILGGSIAGYMSGLTGISGSVRALFLSAYNLSKLEYIAAQGTLGLLIDIVRIPVYIQYSPELPKYVWIASILVVPVSFAGSWVGNNILKYIKQEKFRYVIAFFLIIVACILIINPKYYRKKFNHNNLNKHLIKD